MLGEADGTANRAVEVRMASDRLAPLPGLAFVDQDGMQIRRCGGVTAATRVLSRKEVVGATDQAPRSLDRHAHDVLLRPHQLVAYLDGDLQHQVSRLPGSESAGPHSPPQARSARWVPESRVRAPEKSVWNRSARWPELRH